MPVDTLVRTGIKEVTQRAAQKGTKIAATGNWNKILKPLNSETKQAISKELAPDKDASFFPISIFCALIIFFSIVIFLELASTFLAKPLPAA